MRKETPGNILRICEWQDYEVTSVGLPSFRQSGVELLDAAFRTGIRPGIGAFATVGKLPFDPQRGGF